MLYLLKETIQLVMFELMFEFHHYLPIFASETIASAKE